MAKSRQNRNQKYRVSPGAAKPSAAAAGVDDRSSSRTKSGHDTDQTDRQAGTTSSRRPSTGSSVERATDRAPIAVTAATPAAGPRTRKAQLRLVHIDPWSVMKTSFLLSIAIGITCVVAVSIVWGVLGAAGVWDSINSMVDQTVGSDSGTPFDITRYIGVSRAVGFTMIAAVVDVVLITAIATLGAFVYNLAATLLGGVEVTLAEDR